MTNDHIAELLADEAVESFHLTLAAVFAELVGEGDPLHVSQVARVHAAVSSRLRFLPEVFLAKLVDHDRLTAALEGFRAEALAGGDGGVEVRTLTEDEFAEMMGDDDGFSRRVV